MSPSTTTQVSATNLARGTLAAIGDDHIVLALLGADYRLRLLVGGRPTVRVGKRIAGVIHAQARRIDIVHTGGRYIEPLDGRPRRVQGEVVAVDPHGQTVTVDAAAPIVCTPQPGQRAEQFKVGDFVSFDVMAGARFTPTA